MINKSIAPRVVLHVVTTIRSVAAAERRRIDESDFRSPASFARTCPAISTILCRVCVCACRPLYRWIAARHAWAVLVPK